MEISKQAINLLLSSAPTKGYGTSVSQYTLIMIKFTPPLAKTMLEKKQIMQFLGKWMDLGIILLSKVARAQKDQHHMVKY